MAKTFSDGEFVTFMQSLTSAQLGNLVAEYVNESVHNNWDGHPSRDITAYRNLLKDIMSYYKAAEPGQFGKPGLSRAKYYTKEE